MNSSLYSIQFYSFDTLSVLPLAKIAMSPATLPPTLNLVDDDTIPLPILLPQRILLSETKNHCLDIVVVSAWGLSGELRKSLVVLSHCQSHQIRQNQCSAVEGGCPRGAGVGAIESLMISERMPRISCHQLHSSHTP